MGITYLPCHKARKKYRQNLRIANINISIVTPCPVNKVYFGKYYRDFFYPSTCPEVLIHAYYDEIPQVVLPDKFLLSGIDKMWGIYEINKKKIFIFNPIKYKCKPQPILIKANVKYNKDILRLKSSRYYDMEPVKIRLCRSHQIAIFEPDFKQSVVYVNSGLSPRSFTNPLSYPLLELLLPNLLFSRQGVLFHACGIVDGNRSYLFLGHSGYGKSTIARLWQNEAVVLHDDLIPVRKVGRSYYMFPMPGYNKGLENRFSEGVPISKIFFIHHSPCNKISQKTGILASTLLLLRSIQTVPDLNITKSIQRFCAQLAKEIPCYSLGFAPDEKVFDFVRKAS
jgi:hypothetical protein